MFDPHFTCYSWTYEIGFILYHVVGAWKIELEGHSYCFPCSLKEKNNSNSPFSIFRGPSNCKIHLIIHFLLYLGRKKNRPHPPTKCFNYHFLLYFPSSFSHAPKSHLTKWCKWGSKLAQLIKFLIVK